MKRSRQDGFLLLEVILATAILAVGLFALITSLGRCLAAAQSVKNYTIAQTLLANKAYEFRVEQPTDYLDQEGEFEDYPGFAWARRFEAVDLDPDILGLWKQTIIVSWREGGQVRSDETVEIRYLPQKQQ